MAWPHLPMRLSACGLLPAFLALLPLALASRPLQAADEMPILAVNLTGHLTEIYTVAFSLDGTRLASGSNREVIVWDLSAGKELFTYRITSTNLLGLAFTPDGKRLASADADRMVTRRLRCGVPCEIVNPTMVPG